MTRQCYRLCRSRPNYYPLSTIFFIRFGELALLHFPLRLVRALRSRYRLPNMGWYVRSTSIMIKKKLGTFSTGKRDSKRRRGARSLKMAGSLGDVPLHPMASSCDGALFFLLLRC